MFYHRRILFNFIKDIVEKQHKFSYRLLHKLEIVLYTIYSIRFSYIILTMFHPEQFPLFYRYDAYEQRFRLMSTDRDYFYTLTHIMLLINGIFLEKSFYFSRLDSYTFGEMYDEIVVFCNENYQKCLQSSEVQKEIFSTQLMKELNRNSNSPIPRFLLKLYSKIKVRINIWIDMSYVNKPKLMKLKAKYYPQLSNEIRVRMLVIYSIVENVNFALITTAKLSLVTIQIFNFLNINDKFPLWVKPLVILDLAIAYHLFYRLMLMFIQLFLISVYFPILYMQMFGEINRMLRQIVLKLKQKKLHPSSILSQLNFFRNVNTRASMYLKFSNEELWGWTVFGVFACQLPGNIYTIYRTIDQSLSGSKLAYNLMIVCNQTIMIVVSLLVLAKNSKAVNAAQGHIPPLIGALDSKMILMKLKYMELYERLNSDKLIGISIGPFDSISYQIVFEIFLIYIAYIFFLFDLFM